MAFRIQDPVSSLFWEVDEGLRIRLREKGSVYAHLADGFITNVDTGRLIRTAGNKIVEGDWATAWNIEDGVISMDTEHIIQYDETSSGLRVATSPASWILVPADGAPVAVPEPVAVPAEEEDVPVARGAALIEEALNSQAAYVESEDEA